MGTISHSETGRPGAISQDEIRLPTPRETADGMAALRLGRALLGPLSLAVRASVITALLAEFIARYPERSRGEILRMINQRAHAALGPMAGPEDAP